MPRPCLLSKVGCNCVLAWSLSSALLPVRVAAQDSSRSPPSAAAQNATTPKPTVAPSPDATTHKAHVVPKQHAPTVEDEAVLRHLELLLLLDMMKDYELFHDDAKPREKAPTKP
jgi:hypothetical protein